METVRVWDAPVRLFHWTLLVLVAVMFYTGKTGNYMEWHVRAGYAVLALVLFRVLWGFAGSTTARFASFLRPPGACLEFARRMFSSRPAHVAGHNPLGGWMVVALLAALAFQAGTGLFSNDDIVTRGPLARYVSEQAQRQFTALHYYNHYVLIGLMALHVLAVLYHAVFKKENLVGAMFSGRKSLPAEAAAGLAQARFASPWRALALLVAASTAVYFVVKPPF